MGTQVGTSVEDDARSPSELLPRFRACFGRHPFVRIEEPSLRGGSSQQRSGTNLARTESPWVLWRLLSHGKMSHNRRGVKCWGNNGGGQLGYGTRTLRLVPTEVVGLSGTAKVKEIAAGSWHTCAMTTAARFSAGAAARRGS